MVPFKEVNVQIIWIAVVWLGWELEAQCCYHARLPVCVLSADGHCGSRGD